MSNLLLYCALSLAFLFSFLALFDASQSISTFGSVSRYALGEFVLPKKISCFRLASNWKLQMWQRAPKENADSLIKNQPNHYT